PNMVRCRLLKAEFPASVTGRTFRFGSDMSLFVDPVCCSSTWPIISRRRNRDAQVFETNADVYPDAFSSVADDELFHLIRERSRLPLRDNRLAIDSLTHRSSHRSNSANRL